LKTSRNALFSKSNYHAAATWPKIVEGIRAVQLLSFGAGAGRFKVDVTEGVPPAGDGPDHDTAEWNRRKNAMKISFKGMGLLKAQAQAQGEDGNDGGNTSLLEEIKVQCRGYDDDYFRYVLVKGTCLYNDMNGRRKATCGCIHCGAQIVGAPLDLKERKYPGGAVCPLWCKVEDDKSLSDHMQCADVTKMAGFLVAAKGTNEMTLLEHDELEQGVVPEGMEANDDD